MSTESEITAAEEEMITKQKWSFVAAAIRSEELRKKLGDTVDFSNDGVHHAACDVGKEEEEINLIFQCAQLPRGPPPPTTNIWYLHIGPPRDGVQELSFLVIDIAAGDDETMKLFRKNVTGISAVYGRGFLNTEKFNKLFGI